MCVGPTDQACTSAEPEPQRSHSCASGSEGGQGSDVPAAAAPRGKAALHSDDDNSDHSFEHGARGSSGPPARRGHKAGDGERWRGGGMSGHGEVAVEEEDSPRASMCAPGEATALVRRGTPVGQQVAGGSGDDASSAGDAASQKSGSDVLDAASSIVSAGGGADDDLAVDARCGPAAAGPKNRMPQELMLCWPAYTMLAPVRISCVCSSAFVHEACALRPCERCPAATSPAPGAQSGSRS